MFLAIQPAACDSCHTRHTFSVAEAREPEACASCHMADGNHEVRTAWGFLAVRTNGLAPYPRESEQWWADRVTILQALGVLDPEGTPSARLDVFKAAQVARLSAEELDAERAKMVAVCSQCHSENFALEESGKGDALIEQIDRLMAEVIRIVAGLYQEGLLQKPDNYA